MKKLTLIILMLPLFVFSQNRIEDHDNYAKITLNDGRLIECVIQDENDESVTYYSWHEGGVKTISRDLIKNIKGKKNLPYVAKKKKPKEIQRDIKETIKQQSEVAVQSKAPSQSKVSINTASAGDYLEQAGNNYLAGVSLGIAGGALAWRGSTDSDNKQLIVVGSSLALAGFVCTIVGHTKLIKAGKALNQNKKLSIHPSTSGMGLALKF